LKRIKVLYRKLGKEKAHGLAHLGENMIEIDNRLSGKKHLEILTHESLHILFPEMSEEEIELKSIILTNTLWAEKYRRTDLNNSVPLQDGKL